MSKKIVRIENLSHRYTRNWAIRDINFEIGETGVMGLLGSNGAGKSTAMNILCGVLNQTAGKVYINGIDMQQDAVAAKKLIGFLPQNAPLLMDLTVDEYLKHCAELRLMDKSTIPGALQQAKERCGITHFSGRVIKNLSGGYRQRVGIAQAIIHQPQLVVLDEPTNGLDPNQITEVRRLIKEIAEDRAVIFSSHILSEVQATCKDVRMIESGRMVFSDTMEAFNNYLAPSSLLVTLGELLSLEELLAIPGVTKAELLHGRTYRVYFTGSATISELIVQRSVERGWRLSEITLEKSSLDDIFAQLSKSAN